MAGKRLLLLLGLVGGAALGAEALPDWSGVWLPDMALQNAQITSNPPPWNASAQAQVASLGTEAEGGRPRGLFVNCLPEGMPSWMLISHNAMEILFTPGRVTMLGESDGNRLRRIYTDGRPHEADPDPSFFGDSIGHWDGQTLAVDTIAVLPETYLAVSEAVGLPNDGNLHVTERLHLLQPETLADDLTITAPHILTRSWRTTRLFHREPGVRNVIDEGVCLAGFYSETHDKQGNAAFTPVPQTADGNAKPE